MTATPRRKSNEGSRRLRLKEIAELVRGEILGPSDVEITGVAGLQEAQTGDITFLANARYLPFLSSTAASAVLVGPGVEAPKKGPVLVRTAHPSAAFTKVVALFTPEPARRAPGVHPTAVVDPSAKLAKNVHIGPHAVIEAGVAVGEGSILDAGVFVGQDSTVGRDSRLFPNVVLRERTSVGDRVLIHSGTAIGSDGFGYETADGKHIKIPQTGAVRIEDDVEIGANVCIDRGRFQDTVIGRGTKIDNLVQIAHNVVIGPDCLLVSQTGISGSTRLEEGVIIAGQAGLVGHITIGAAAVIGAGAGVTKSVPAKAVVLGSPAKEIETQKKLIALINRLPELYERVRALEKP